MIQTNRKTRRRSARLLGAVSVGAIAFGVLPISPASAAITVDDACGSFIEEDGFTDTGPEDADFLPNDVEDAVDCLLAYGITSGKTATTFATGDIVTRGQLATFVLNILDQVEGFTRPANAPDAFPDDETSVHEDNINDAAALGLVQGFNDGRFRPDAGVTRAQMATFIVNTLEEAGITVPTGDDAFDDDDTSVHEDNINSLEELDIVDGTATGDYDPDREVTRGTMAFFLVRTLEVLVDAGLIEPVGTETPPTNQTLNVTPTDAVSLVFVAPNPDSATTDDRQYTVTGLSATEDYRITLVNGDNVTTSAEGVTTFVEDMATGLADAGTVAADITVVNGAPNAFDSDVVAPGIQRQTVGGVVPVAGNITFTVDGEASETVVPVVYVDSGASTRLELNEDNSGRPIEAFGVGGEITYTPAEAEAGFSDFVAVTAVDRANDSFASATETFTYDGNDRFFIDGAQATLAQFEAALSTGDNVDVFDYQQEAELFSEFDLDNVDPPTPTSVEAEKGATGATSNDITVTVVTTSTTFDSVVIQRAPVTGAGNGDEVGTGDIGTYATIATVTTDASATDSGFQYVDADVPAGSYRYRAALVNDGDQGDFEEDDANETSVAPSTDVTAPTLLDTRITADNGTAAVIDTGDIIAMQFSENMAAATNTGRFRFSDPEGEIFEVRCVAGGVVAPGNATCVLGAGDANADGDTTDAGELTSRLQITLLGNPLKVGGPTGTGAAQAPGTITEVSAQFDDANGNQVALTGDVVIDNEF